jgi:hypothetical protein
MKEGSSDGVGDPGVEARSRWMMSGGSANDTRRGLCIGTL